MRPPSSTHTPLTAAFLPPAGVAHNKILSKLASGLHKPSQQTLVPASAVPELLQDLPIPKLRQLGGKFGEEVSNTTSSQSVSAIINCCKAGSRQFWAQLTTDVPDIEQLVSDNTFGDKQPSAWESSLGGAA